jgi:hypothetical protein
MTSAQPQQLSDRELLVAARHKSKRAIEALVAELRPRPDVATVVRRVPAAKPPESSTALSLAPENTTEHPMRYQLPDGDLVAVLDRALTLLLREVRKQRSGLVERPRQPREKTDCRPSSRSIPAEVRRHVFERDGGRCTYVDARGRRCGARELLEFHHLDPWARRPHPG